jgi:hypothetical protein
MNRIEYIQSWKSYSQGLRIPLTISTGFRPIKIYEKSRINDKLYTKLSTDVHNCYNKAFLYYSVEVINSKVKLSKYLWIVAAGAIIILDFLDTCKYDDL